MGSPKAKERALLWGGTAATDKTPERDSNKMLLVEPDRRLCGQLCAALEDYGICALTAYDLAAAKEIIAQAKLHGALLDWQEGLGPAVLSELQRSSSNADLPMVMMLAGHDAVAVARGAKAGVRYFLTKPISQAHLKAVVREVRAAMLDERRNYQRVALQVAVRCVWEEQVIQGVSLNVSASGLLLEMTPQPDLDARLDVRFALGQEAAPFSCRGRVVRSDGGGVGIHFLGLSGVEHTRLVEDIERYAFAKIEEHTGVGEL